MVRDVRLGDDIDDFCVRCKRVMNHAVVSVVSGVAAKVRCRTCHNDHDFRHEQPPPPKVDPRKAAALNGVLKAVDPAVAAEVDLELDVAPLEGDALESAEDVEIAEGLEPEAVETEAVEPEGAEAEAEVEIEAEAAAAPAKAAKAAKPAKAAAKRKTKEKK
ncbi:MAG TPA: hypothetical protein VHW24_19275 [Bryobacteraceae bacterium]|jgi:hypothetical protein|nr:hypothetical protein [Bryobacteraceae bacterium]